jgi:hypothetical protein
VIKKLLSKIFNASASGFAFILAGFFIAPIFGVFITGLLKTDLSLTTKSLILAYAIFGAFLLGDRQKD